MINFNGRPDGLGNRIEELIILESYCVKHNVKCNYFWNNTLWRKYPILLKCKNIEIQDKQPYKENILKELDINKEEFKNIKDNIIYIDDLNYEDISFIAVHIRATDKLNNRGRDEFTLDILLQNINRLAEILNKKYQDTYVNLFICGDDDKYITMFKSKLVKTINIINPYENLIKHPVYRDFFTLVKAKEIYMCPKFSSYVSTASILGDNLIYSFYNEKDTSLTRYNCKCILI